ncbi:MAG: helix-turn-helix transcriptional regulator [bacterium]|nr:helix-turn-helix transcriptional regulator [bacterium]
MSRKNLKEARRAAGLTQQQVADKLEIGIRQYQRMEAGCSNGSFENWDVLEDMLKVHQRKLREISNNHLVPEENQRGRPKNQKVKSMLDKVVQ